MRSESICIERCDGVPIAFVCRTELAKGSMHRSGCIGHGIGELKQESEGSVMREA